MVVRQLLKRGDFAAWVDVEPLGKAQSYTAILSILREVFNELDEIIRHKRGRFSAWRKALSAIEGQLSGDINNLVEPLRKGIAEITKSLDRNIYVFLDDAHYIGVKYQPLLYDVIFRILKGNRGWLKIAAVRNLAKTFDNAQNIGLQVNQDLEEISLDLTLENPGAAREHLIKIMGSFLNRCGIRKRSELIGGAAIDRLVWCSAGVPRDFLQILNLAIHEARESKRQRISVQDINLAVGKFSDRKLQDLDEEAPEVSAQLKECLKVIQQLCLDTNRTNAFLAKNDIQEAAEKVA